MVLVFAEWDAWVGLGTSGLAFATFLLAGLAIFQEPLRRHFSRSVLDMEIRAKPPDFIQIGGNDRTGLYVGELFYMRIRVTHVEHSPAENAEIMVTRLWRKVGTRKWEEVPTFVPMSLLWSNTQPPQTSSRIPAGLFRHCDLGRFMEDPDEEEKPLFIFSLAVQPNSVDRGDPPNFLKPGVHRFEITLSGDNTNKITQKWNLSFGDEWSNDGKEMLSKIKVTKVRLNESAS